MKRKPSPQSSPAPALQRVLIVDDHPFLRMGLTEALAREPGLSVCGGVGTAEEALTLLGKLHPDVIVTDLHLPGKSGLELIKDLASLRPGLPVLVLSSDDEKLYAERCLRAGAAGYVTKSEGPEKLATAIRAVLAGGIHVSTQISARILKAVSGRRDVNAHSPLSALTDREFEVFEWLGRGLATKEIATRLHLSPKTIEAHRLQIKSKLALATAAELLVFAARWVGSGG